MMDAAMAAGMMLPPIRANPSRRNNLEDDEEYKGGDYHHLRSSVASEQNILTSEYNSQQPANP
jgi:hypothetical protein